MQATEAIPTAAAPAIAAGAIAIPILNSGEHYAGIILGEDGIPSHHLILLPGEAAALNWQDAKAWAETAGGELPTRCEQALLYANLKKQFEPDWYWSGEQHASYSGYAWCQDFSSGYQYSSYTNDELRARAVRRLKI